MFKFLDKSLVFNENMYLFLLCNSLIKLYVIMVKNFHLSILACLASIFFCQLFDQHLYTFYRVCMFII